MFDAPYNYEIVKKFNDWRDYKFTQIDLSDGTIMRMHMIQKPISESIYYKEDYEYEFIFDRGIIGSADDVFPNNLGDHYRIYSTVYEYCVDFVTTIKPNVLSWATGGYKTRKIYELLGKKYSNDKRFNQHRMVFKTMTGSKNGWTILAIKEELADERLQRIRDRNRVCFSS